MRMHSYAAGRPCPMPSAAGKRVGRVLAGCSKPEVRDKPGLQYLARILGLAGIPT